MNLEIWVHPPHVVPVDKQSIHCLMKGPTLNFTDSAVNRAGGFTQTVAIKSHQTVGSKVFSESWDPLPTKNLEAIISDTKHLAYKLKSMFLV